MLLNDLGKKFVIEECDGIRINNLLDKYKRGMKEIFIKSEFETSGSQIELTTSKTGFGGKRYWFSCPQCKERVGIIYKHPLENKMGCRRCLDLKYRKQRQKGMVETKIF